MGPWNLELTGSQDLEYQARVKLFGGQGEFVDALVGYIGGSIQVAVWALEASAQIMSEV